LPATFPRSGQPLSIRWWRSGLIESRRDGAIGQ
jgi:hypothetical protein